MPIVDVVIGYDRRETIAAHVLAHSIDKRSSLTPSISMWRIDRLPMWRERDPKQSTDFAFSRFLVPSNRNFRGWTIFMDCDMLCRSDIVELLELGMRNRTAVSVVKHSYIPKGMMKFLDQPQTVYERKNWSSVIVFDNERCLRLTEQFVNNVKGLELHQFRWLPDEEIGSIPLEWNHLVGEYEPNPKAKLVHFTLGTPCFMKYQHCEFAEEWFEEKNAMLYYDRYKEYSIPDKDEYAIDEQETGKADEGGSSFSGVCEKGEHSAVRGQGVLPRR